jgi:glycosyltransferase involved in cell wall biosynthesis
VKARRPLVVIAVPGRPDAVGGVERFAHLLGASIEDLADVQILGVHGEVPTAVRRLGGSEWWRAAKIREGLARRVAGADLIITNGFLGALIPRQLRKIHVFHGTMVEATRAVRDGYPPHERFRRAVGGGLAEAVSGRGAARVVAVSESVRQEVRKYYGLSSVHVIENAVDTSIFCKRDRAEARRSFNLLPAHRYALFVGRAEIRKGIDLVEQACDVAGYDLLIAGPTGFTGATHLGNLDPVRLAMAYAAADCVVFPTRYEACSYVLLEAMAVGVPVLTTAVGWMPTLLSAVPGYKRFLTTSNLASLAGGLRRLGEDPDMDARIVAAARDFTVQNNALRAWGVRWSSLIADSLEAR